VKIPSTFGLEFGLQALNPSSETYADIVNVSPFAEVYGADVNNLHHELPSSETLAATYESLGHGDAFA